MVEVKAVYLCLSCLSGCLLCGLGAVVSFFGVSGDTFWG